MVNIFDPVQQGRRAADVAVVATAQADSLALEEGVPFLKIILVHTISAQSE